MRQQFVRNIFFILFINLLVKSVWFFAIDRNVQIAVGYEDYGLYQTLFNLGVIFQIVLDFGLTQYNSKEVAAKHSRIALIFSSMLWARVFLSLLYMLIVFIVAALMGYAPRVFPFLASVLAIQVLNSLVLFLRSNVSALQYFRTDGVLAVVDRLLMILVCGAFLLFPSFFGHFKIEWFVYSQILSYGVAVLVAFWVLKSITPLPIRFAFQTKIIIAVIRKSAPYALLVFLMAIYTRSDAVMIERLCGAEGKLQAGIYASAFRLLDMSNIFGYMIAGVLLPMFAKMIAEKQEVASTVRLSVNMMLPLAFVLSLSCLFFGGDIMHLLYHRASGNTDGLLLGVLMLCFPAYCLMYIYSTLLTANGSIVLLNKISLGIVVLNLVLHTFFISYFQALGAAIAVAITEWVVAFCVIVAAHKIFALPHNYKWLISHLGFIACAAGLAFTLRYLLPGQILAVPLFALLSSLLLLPFGFINVSGLKTLLMRKTS